MAERNIVEVVIDGRIYQLMGTESESYLHEVAGYLNTKIASFRREFKGYNKLDDSLKSLLMEINICDDLFTEQDKVKRAQKELEEQQREAYSAKHDLINTQMKLEAALKQLEQAQIRLAELEQEKNRTSHNFVTPNPTAAKN